MKRNALALAMLLLMATNAYGATVTVACAANFTTAMKEIAASYEARSGTTIQLSFGSTGMLYGQITNGAPYDLFFAADRKRPALLHENGLADRPQVYALGRVVLWTADTTEADNWEDALPLFERVAVANPKTAPYGAAAIHVLEESGLGTAVRNRLVFGKSVGQAFHYAHTGAADAAFCAKSQALAARSGSWWPVPTAQPVSQAACRLTGSDSARDFLDYVLHAPAAAAIKTKYGYE